MHLQTYWMSSHIEERSSVSPFEFRAYAPIHTASRSDLFCSNSATKNIKFHFASLRKYYFASHLHFHLQAERKTYHCCFFPKKRPEEKKYLQLDTEYSWGEDTHKNSLLKFILFVSYDLTALPHLLKSSHDPWELWFWHLLLIFTSISLTTLKSHKEQKETSVSSLTSIKDYHKRTVFLVASIAF